VSADVVIVGAGVIGAATAFHLSLLGAGDVLVLEHRIRIPTTDQSPADGMRGLGTEGGGREHAQSRRRASAGRGGA
jgi:glycine/D-amino acid oxidase-like deaminating enzyme